MTTKKKKTTKKKSPSKVAELKGQSTTFITIDEISPVHLPKNRTCRRHANVTYPIGKSCPRCVTACQRYSAIMANKAFTLPCPNCNNATREEDGGCIKTYYSKADHYGCGNCKISYNLKGEKVSWESGKDEYLFNREITHRK